MLTRADLTKLKRCMFAAQCTSLPPVTTHNVVEEASDPVLTSIRRCRLFNTQVLGVETDGLTQNPIKSSFLIANILSAG